MNQVWKFEIEPSKELVEMPQNAEILSVAFQENMLFVWARVDVAAPLEKRTLIVRGTGHDMPTASLWFLGTAHKDGLVFHVFEDLNAPVRGES